MKEKEVIKLVLDRLEPHFFIEKEVTGFSPIFNKPFRIDAIIKPKDVSKWANKDIKFGIEFKEFREHDVNEIHFHHQVKQAIDYSYSTFNGERIPVLLCPTIEKLKNHHGVFEYKILAKHLNAFNIGEIKTTNRGLSIVFSDIHIIWSEKYGIGEGKTWKFKDRIGGQKV